MSETTLRDQIGSMITENQSLRVKSDCDDKLIEAQRAQYDDLAGNVETMRNRYEVELHLARTERDHATRKFKEITTLLMQVSELIVESHRARLGDETPPAITSPHLVSINDDRIPIVRLG